MSSREVVPLSAEHREGVIELYAEIFGPAKAGLFRDRFDWQYRDCPARRPDQITNWVMLREDRVVGHLGVIPMDIQVGEARYQGCWGLDLMVHPDHRSRRSLAELFSRLDTAAEVPLAYGMADVVARIFKRRGYLHRAVGSHMLRFTSLSGALRLVCRQAGQPRAAGRILAALRWKLHNLRRWLSPCPRPGEAELAGWSAELLAEPTPEVEALWRAIAADYPVAVLRDEAQLRWRYCNQLTPGRFLLLRRGGEVAVAAVLEVFAWDGIRAGQISELLIPRGQAAGLLPIAVHFIADVLRRQGIDAILCQGFPSDLRSELARNGFTELLPGRTENHLVYDPDGRLPQELVLPADNWLLSAGDCDRTTAYPRIEWVV